MERLDYDFPAHIHGNNFLLSQELFHNLDKYWFYGVFFFWAFCGGEGINNEPDYLFNKNRKDNQVQQSNSGIYTFIPLQRTVFP